MARPLRVLITGARGFVGSWLIRHLAEVLPPESEFLGVSRSGEGTGKLDIADSTAVDACVKALRPTTVIHLASVSSQAEARENIGHAWDVNFKGTMHLAESVMRHMPDAIFVFAGSSEAYGRTFKRISGPLDERAALAPQNVYAATKAAADLLLGQMSEDGLRVVRFRPFNQTGPGQSPRFVVAAFAHQIAAIERGLQPPIIKVGNLEVWRDFLDVRDIIAAYGLAVMANDWLDGEPFNLASGVPRRIGDILDDLLKLSSARVSVSVDKTLVRTSDTPMVVGDARRAAEVFGWRPNVAWATTLCDVLDAARRTIPLSAGTRPLLVSHDQARTSPEHIELSRFGL